jgi:hypothetical protein
VSPEQLHLLGMRALEGPLVPSVPRLSFMKEILGKLMGL